MLSQFEFVLKVRNIWLWQLQNYKKKTKQIASKLNVYFTPQLFRFSVQQWTCFVICTSTFYVNSFLKTVLENRRVYMVNMPQKFSVIFHNFEILFYYIILSTIIWFRLFIFFMDFDYALLLLLRFNIF